MFVRQSFAAPAKRRFAAVIVIAGSLVVALLVGGYLVSGSSVIGAERVTTAKLPSESVEMFAAMKSGEIEVKLIQIDSKEANVLITNKTKRPLSVRLPETFAGVPVLAQQFGNNNNNNNNNNQNQNQGTGGGLGNQQGGNQQGGAFNVAPEKVGKLKVVTVCLEHGKADPSPRVAYEIKPLETFNSDPKVAEVIKLMVAGQVNQRVAQAAAWHFANGMSWEQLAAKKINRLGRPDESYFSANELQSAVKLAAVAEKQAKQRPIAESPSSGEE